MSGELYLTLIQKIIKKLASEELLQIKKAATVMADSIEKERLVYLFGSGHSILPCMDIFPRYGTFVGLQPITDNRLMWSNVAGIGGTRELLWIERQEGYVKEILKSFNMSKEDSIIIFSHGGVNAAPVEMALLCKEKGLKIIGVTNKAYLKISKTNHSSGKRLGDIADIVIDNHAPIEDSMVKIKNLNQKVAPASTITSIAISMSLVAETAAILTVRGKKLDIFISPTVEEAEKNHNDKVYDSYMEKIYRKW